MGGPFYKYNKAQQKNNIGKTLHTIYSVSELNSKWIQWIHSMSKMCCKLLVINKRINTYKIFLCPVGSRCRQSSQIACWSLTYHWCDIQHHSWHCMRHWIHPVDMLHYHWQVLLLPSQSTALEGKVIALCICQFNSIGVAQLLFFKQAIFFHNLLAHRLLEEKSTCFTRISSKFQITFTDIWI